jgi:leader peptidase (prepilin peptidase)/N-methyltransferase
VGGTIDWQIVSYVYVAFLGLVLGSFYNVVGIRVPQKETLLGYSHCPKCNHRLHAVELIPIVSFIIQKGRCKHCGSSISVKYFVIELLTGVLFLFSYVFLQENMIEYIVIVVFISLMVIVSVSDIHYRIVPDIILLIFLPVILVLRLISDIMPWYEALLGGAFGFGFLYLISLYGKWRFKKEALGGGDIKLYVLIGIVLGIQNVFVSILFSAVIALIYNLIKKQQGYFAFVPFIFAGSLIAYFWGTAFTDWYMSLFF